MLEIFILTIESGTATIDETPKIIKLARKYDKISFINEIEKRLRYIKEMR